MRISVNGIELIKHFEGFVGHPYRDAVGKWTIGYGHLIQPDEKFTVIGETEALALLIKDVAKAENAVNRMVTAPLNQNQFDALCSFVYNLGAGRLQQSTLLRRLNARNYEAAAKEFLRWIYADGVMLNGLKARREAESELFMRAA